LEIHTFAKVFVSERYSSTVFDGNLVLFATVHMLLLARGGSRNFGKGGPVRGRSSEPSAEGPSAGGGSGGPPPENFEKLDAISCNLAYIFEIRMASDIIQNWAFAEQKTVAATISIHTHTHTPPHFQKLLGFRPL